ncbi:DUF6660 family protein [Gramella sp. AN32]|uniref:DUF6660 family protein n=1 Tax=Christiangramia antarctica TaxID=2058158 RepID=A0ABW5X6W2_9FLAO|nr:hypothetical protein [Gramella sp. AN32]
MKILAIILSFYILALNALPCDDINTYADNFQTEVAHSGDSDHNQSAFDLCPPFCTCHCCHVHTIDFGASSFEPLTPLVSSEIFGHFDNIGQETTYSLLQPPRV